MTYSTGLIVFGDDGSPSADIAWLWIIGHRWPGWRADVVTATPPPFPPPASGLSSQPKPWDSPHPRVVPAQAELAEVQAVAAPGDPRALLCRRHDASLMVLGTRGLGRLRGVLLGSTTQWLLHHPPAPLAIIRSARPVQRVLACVDGSAHAQRALEAFAALPWAAGTTVTVLAVYDGWADVEAGLGNAVEALERAGIDAKPLEVRGKATQTIMQHVEELEPELVVMGTRGLLGWDRVLLGSTASAVVHTAPCSVLVACADEAADQTS